MVLYSDLNTAQVNLESWLLMQPHLPKIDPLVLRRFIHKCHGDLEKTKKFLDLHYSYRGQHPQIFAARNDMMEDVSTLIHTIDMIALPDLTSEGYKVNMIRFSDNDLEKFNFDGWVKIFFICHDLRACLPDGKDDFSNGELMIFDMTGLTFRHLTKLNLHTLGVLLSFFQKYVLFRVRGIHVINSQPSLDKLLHIIKPLIRKKLFERVHFYQESDVDKFYQVVPKNMLPEEYGGKAGTINDIKNEWVEVAESKIDYLSDPKYWHVDLNKKPNHNQTEVNLMEGSFRRLNID